MAAGNVGFNILTCSRCCVYFAKADGEVSEWLIEPVSKTGVPFREHRGFESRPLRCFLCAGGYF
jgi:hypothetical protein